MNERHIVTIATELNLNARQVIATAELLAEGGTVPFIARYRKEATGSLDEVAISAIQHRLQQLHELDERRAAILKSLEERELLTDELKGSIEAAGNMATLEDLYLPYRPKRRTRAMIAKEKGLEPLAIAILAQDAKFDPTAEAAKYIDAEKGVTDIEEALAGARDIIAEQVNEDADARGELRELFRKEGIITSVVAKGKETEGAKFRDYFDWKEPLAKAAGHRLLAMFRGEKEEMLRLTIAPPEEKAIDLLNRRFVKGSNASSEQVKLAIQDAYGRLMMWSMETEMRVEAKRRADLEAIGVFAANLRELLMAAPLGEKRVLAIDPGFRTGCKVVCLDAQGKLLYNTTIFPTTSEGQKAEAANIVLALAQKFQIESIAIGNGTASRETEAFVRGLGLPESIQIIMVNESGASVYSASEVAREEFPAHDVTVRGSVSIGRRLMDPLAELVKIDPKSIGVGQYQHDVDQTELKGRLDEVVVSCVNAVGVEVNTASKQLLAYVSGLGTSLAKNIVEFRQQNGPFKSREQLRKVPRLGPKAYEQAAGFLRIRGGEQLLDRSAVHPESYGIVEQMAKDVGCTVADLMNDAALRAKIDLKKYVTDTVGLPTLTDIVAELAKPGRDPRAQFEAHAFADGVHEIQDLKPGMRLPGIITNVTKFGAFVDVGVHQDGLVHVSQLSDEFVSDPMEVVRVSQRVMVTVLEVDLERRRIALSMRTNPEEARGNGRPRNDGDTSRRSDGKPRTDRRQPPPSEKPGTMAFLFKKAGIVPNK